MTREELLEKYKGGFSFGEDYETIEIIPNDKDTDDNKLCLWAYDANFMPLPDISKWSQSARDKLADKLKKRLSNLNTDVWIDDLQIKEKNDD